MPSSGPPVSPTQSYALLTRLHARLRRGEQPLLQCQKLLLGHTVRVGLSPLPFL